MVRDQVVKPLQQLSLLSPRTWDPYPSLNCHVKTIMSCRRSFDQCLKKIQNEIQFPMSIFSTNNISVCLGLEHKSPRFVSSIAKYKAHSRTSVCTKLACEQLNSFSMWRKNTTKRGRKKTMKKFALKTISKFYPKHAHTRVFFIRISWKRGCLSPKMFLSEIKDIFCWLLQEHMARFKTFYVLH